jgi:hypothetical protein
LLTNDVRRHAMRKRAYAASRPTTWAQTAKRYLAAFDLARETSPISKRTRAGLGEVWGNGDALPQVQTGHFHSMCDSTGLLQHAVHSVPDRAHGYCVDDNARALLLSSTLASFGEALLPEPLTARFAAFIQHAWNADTRRFRNFMSYDRPGLGGQSWSDAVGVGRMRPQRYRSISPQVGSGPVQDGPARRRALSISPRLGVHTARAGRVLRVGGGRSDRRPHA